MAKKTVTPSRRSFLERLVGWAVLLVFLVLPLLYFPNRAASYVTSKQYFFIGIVDVLIVLWTWLLVTDSRYRLTKQNLLWLSPLFLFLVSLTVSGIWGVEPSNSFFSTVESGTGLILLYHAFAFACIVSSIIRVQKQTFLNYIIQANLFASIVLAVMTFYTGNSGVFEINSKMLDYSSGGATMGNSLLVGAYFIFSVFLTLYLIIHETKVWKKVLYWLGILLMLCSPIYLNANIFKGKPLSSAYLFLGEARIAAIALLIGLFFSLFIWLTTLKEQKVWNILGGIGIVFMVVAGSIGLHQVANPQSSLQSFFIAQAGNRVSDWGEAIQGIKAKPLLGWGPENYHVVHQLYLNPIVFAPGHGNEVWALHPHNNTLEVLVDGGIIGFILYLGVLAALFGGLFVLYRKHRISGSSYALFTGLLIAFIIQQQMIYDSIVSYVMFFTIVAIVAGLMHGTDEQQYVNKPVSNTVKYSIGTPIVIIMFPVWLYAAYLPAQKMDEYQAVTTMTSDARTKVYEHLFHSPGSYAIDTDAEFFTDPLFYSYSGQEQQLKANPLYQHVASAEINALITAVNPIWQSTYYDYHLTLSLIQLENLNFYLTGNTQSLAQADIYAKRALLLSPTDPQIYTAYAQTLVYEKNIPGAILLLNKAIQLAPSYQSAIGFKSILSK